jgi:hypothetical protein
VASLIVEGDELIVRLSGWERMVAFRGDVRMPVAAVRDVEVEPDPWKARAAAGL